MKKIMLGVCVVAKEYDNVLMTVLQELNQTHKMAAKDLGISVSTFHKMLRQRWKPNFHTNRGKDLSERIEAWCGLTGEELFPKAMFTKEFVSRKTTHVKSIPYEL